MGASTKEYSPWCVRISPVPTASAHQVLGNGSVQNNNGVDFTLSVGNDSFESTGGFITLRAFAPSVDLCKPKSLVATLAGANTFWIRKGDSLRQIKAPLGLADI